MRYVKTNSPPMVDDPLVNSGLSILNEEIEKMGRIVNLLTGKKGEDKPSAGTLDISDFDGNYFDVTGTTTITAIGSSGKIGTIIRLHFDASLALTHHATNLILPGGANITTVAGDEAIFIEYDMGKWRCIVYTKANGQALVLQGHKTTHESGGSDAIKLDDLASPDDNTDLDLSISKHGLCPKAPDDITKFLRGDAGWGIPAGVAGDKIEEGNSKVEVVDLGTGYIQTLADALLVRKDQVLGNIQPLQPAFLAYNSVTDPNVTGDGTTLTVGFNAEVFDQGGNFATPTFTAPVTGRYPLNAIVRFDDLDADTYHTAEITLVTSNRNYPGVRVSGVIYGSGGVLSVQFSVIADMDANDTAHVTVAVAGGAKSVDIQGGGDLVTCFSGALLC